MFEKEAGYRPLRKSTIGDYSKLKIVHCNLNQKHTTKWQAKSFRICVDWFTKLLHWYTSGPQ